MKIYINSKEQEIPEQVKTVAQLIGFLGLPTGGTGIGINNILIKAIDWPTAPLSEGDKVTIISATYGG